jgi:hypothetical protein
MGQITQIAFALRDLTQQELNEQSSDEESDNKDVESTTKSMAKRKDMARWLKFCKNKIEKIEKVWSRKLEDPRDPDSDSDESANAVQEPEYEEDDLFADFAMPRDFLSKSQSMYMKRDDDMTSDVAAGLAEMGHFSKDDSDAMVKDYGHNVYWTKLESEHDIDDLMKELD